MGVVDRGQSGQSLAEGGEKSGHYSQHSESHQRFRKWVSVSSHSSSHTPGCSAVSRWPPLHHPSLNAVVPPGSVLALFSLPTVSSPSNPQFLTTFTCGLLAPLDLSSGSRSTYKTAYLLSALDSSDVSNQTSQLYTHDITPTP